MPPNTACTRPSGFKKVDGKKEKMRAEASSEHSSQQSDFAIVEEGGKIQIGMTSQNNGKKWLIAIVTIIGILIFACVLFSLIPANPITFASSMVRIDIPKNATVITDIYAEPSFPTGDGYTWMVLQIPHEEIVGFTNLLLLSPDWKSLPLPNELAESERFLQPTIMLSGQEEIPIATATGYYIFIDEQMEERRQVSDITKPYYERSSFNYRFGLFNDLDGRLYVWSIDT